MSLMCRAGIDVSAQQLEVRYRSDPQQPAQKLTVPNQATGHQRLLKALCRAGLPVRVVLEATGVYHLDLAVSLYRAEQVEVMVAPPKAMHCFSEALGKRAKTDPEDAQAALEFCERMEFEPWQAPCPASWDLRAKTRRIAVLIQQRTAERNRKHAARCTHQLTGEVKQDIQEHVDYLNEKIEALRRSARQLIGTTPSLERAYQLLISTQGIGRASALQILGEICLFPEGLSPKQWVAMAGLDPSVCRSGTSVHGSRHISRAGSAHLRRALYMPALVAARHQHNVKLYYNRLQQRGKPKMVALVAVMRKLLHSIHGMLRTSMPFDGEKFYASTAAEA